MGWKSSVFRHLSSLTATPHPITINFLMIWLNQDFPYLEEEGDISLQQTVKSVLWQLCLALWQERVLVDLLPESPGSLFGRRVFHLANCLVVVDFVACHCLLIVKCATYIAPSYTVFYVTVSKFYLVISFN